MLIQTSRFGQIPIEEADVLSLPEGILGFVDLRKMVLLDDPNDELFAWMQSCEIPGIAFPILEPELFAPEYRVILTRHDLEALQATANSRLRYLTIVTIPDDPTLMTANLKAPIVVNVEKRIARQCVLQDNALAIREPIFAKLQQRFVQNPPPQPKSVGRDLGIVVPITSKRPPEIVK